LAKKPKISAAPRILTGVPVAPGIAVGKVRRLDERVAAVDERVVAPEALAGEIVRFRQALERARGEIEGLREATRAELGESEAKIFDVQLLVLKDPLAVERTIEAVRAEGRNVEYIFRRHMLEMIDGLAALSDSYFSDRAVDLLDVKRRVLRHLCGDTADGAPALRRGVWVGRELAPSDAVLLDPTKVLGLATEAGGTTSHAAIMARARGIPAVVGVRGLGAAVRDGDVIALDGFKGTLEINPSRERLERFQARKRAFSKLQRQHARFAGLAAETQDGRRIMLSANMEMPDEVAFIRQRGAEGIGLFRTEFFFMWKRRAPTEDEQVEAYSGVVAAMAPDSVVIRVLDVGGDKMASYMGMARERNPFLGMRGIRYLVAHPDIFRTQLRAILRAGASGKATILLPMVSSLHEFRYARRLVREAITALKKKKIPHDANPVLGVMIEVPSAVMMADEFAREADFLSVGSNDLIQYLLAIDRDNEALQDLYKPHHPAVLRALDQTAAAAHRHGKWVSICGEMAGDPLSLPLLVGMGFDRLSVSPSLIPEVKQALRSLNYEDCRRLAKDALACHNADDVAKLIEKRLGSRFSDLLQLTNEPNGKATRPRRTVSRK
jgi:phosphotransferase system enzyme I (PtsI)